MTRLNAVVCLLCLVIGSSAFAQDDTDDRSVHVITARHAPVEEVAGPVHRVVGGDFRISVDERTNSFIVLADDATLQRIQEVVALLDLPIAGDPGARSEEREVNVRVVWLVSGLEGGRSVPGDMRDVVDELARIGVGDLSLAAQSVVRTTTGDGFGTRFTVEVGSAWSVAIEGAAEMSGDACRLHLRIDGDRDSDGATTRLNTTITTTAGHYVVLGVSPILNMDSAFVVQVTDVD